VARRGLIFGGGDRFDDRWTWADAVWAREKKFGGKFTVNQRCGVKLETV